MIMPRTTINQLMDNDTADSTTHAVLSYHIEAKVRELSDAFVDKRLKVSARPAMFDAYAKEWLDMCQSANEFTVVEAKVLGRLNAGLGNAAIHEVGFSFHHTFGVPYLPGSTIKGWLASFAKQHVDGLPDAVRETMFGTHDKSGVVIFHDALPKNKQNIEIATDIVNPHQKYYYRGTHNDAPSDMDSPTPVQFVTVVKGTTFCIPIQCVDVDYRNLAVGVLKMALEHSAIGAKTNAGYGRMQYVRTT
jgi:CRISPR-associated protein Cmr6